MDAYEATKIVLQRIQTLDPENASKIMGLLLIQDHDEQEMIRLALAPESLLHSVIFKARKDLILQAPRTKFFSDGLNLFGSGEVDLVDQFSFLNNGQDLALSPSGVAQPNWGGSVDGFHHRRSFSGSDNCFGSEDTNCGLNWKPCLYFARGYCKNGTSCRFLHNGGILAGDNAAPFIGSPLEQSRFELLRLKRFELQYQHLQTEISPRINGGPIMVNPSSRQIYLTFPADSSFKEEDVSNYFNIYGPVQDVRIPNQQKRMFGFVTFLFPDTVKIILAKGNPHFVCDSRVLVKPYKEKGNIPDKFRHVERGDFGICRSPTGQESINPFELPPGARMFYDAQKVLWRRRMEEEAAIELQNQRLLMGFKLLDISTNTLSSGYTSPKKSEDNSLILVDANLGSVSKPEKGENNLPERLEHNLPDSLSEAPYPASLTLVTSDQH